MFWHPIARRLAALAAAVTLLTGVVTALSQLPALANNCSATCTDNYQELFMAGSNPQFGLVGTLQAPTVEKCGTFNPNDYCYLSDWLGVQDASGNLLQIGYLDAFGSSSLLAAGYTTANGWYGCPTSWTNNADNDVVFIGVASPTSFTGFCEGSVSPGTQQNFLVFDEQPNGSNEAYACIETGPPSNPWNCLGYIPMAPEGGGSLEAADETANPEQEPGDNAAQVLGGVFTDTVQNLALIAPNGTLTSWTSSVPNTSYSFALTTLGSVCNRGGYVFYTTMNVNGCIGY